MNAILIHLGCQGPYITSPEPPAHMQRCIEQYLLFNTMTPLYVLTNRAYLPLIPQYLGVYPVAVEDYASDELNRFSAHFNYAADEFWTVTTTRFFCLERFVRENNLAPAVHFENDVLVYFDVEKAAPVFERLYGPRMAATPCDPDHLTSGFMYFGSAEALARMTAFFVDMLAEHGVRGFERKFRVDMMNDMTLLKRYADTRGAGGVNFLPVLPFGEFGRGYAEFGAIFDPGGFGQYIGGTRGSRPGTTYAEHIVGGVLRAHPEYRVVWQGESGRRCPYFSYEGKLAKMNSLHIHSKNMLFFMSRSDV